MSAAPSTRARIAPSVRVACRNMVVRFRSRTVVATSTTGYNTAITGSRVISEKAEDSPYLINAEKVHGDEQVFWLAKRDFKVQGGAPMPMWDRFAQTAILLSRRAARVPQEAAFRLMAVYMKLILITKLVDLSSMMLPVWMSHNVQGLLGSELEKKNGDGEPKKEGAAEGKKDDATAAAPAASDAPKA